MNLIFIMISFLSFPLIFAGFSSSVISKTILACLQRHSAVLQAQGMDEDDMPEINDETLLDEEAMAR